MIRYLAVMGAVSTLARLPGGTWFYHQAGELVQRNTRGRELPLMRAGVAAVQKALQVTDPGEGVLDLGTGWYYKDAILYALTGRFRVIAFDVQHLARMRYVQNYLALLSENADELEHAWQIPAATLRERLACWQSSSSLVELRKAAQIELLVGPPPLIPLPDQSIGFISSYCVLPHIPVETLHEELGELVRCLRPGGYMAHLIGYEDHYSFFDPTVSPFRYYRYGDRSYRLLFENALQFQNRLLWPDFKSIFENHGLTAIEEVADVLDADRRAVRQLKHRFAARFQVYSDDVLARRHSRVMVQRRL